MIDRASPDDLMSLASERGGTPMQVGAVVVPDTSTGFDPTTIGQQINLRSQRIPRLTHDSSPCRGGVVGRCGPSRRWCRGRTRSRRPVAQNREVTGGLLALAAELVCRPLPRERPLWKAVLVVAGALAIRSDAFIMDGPDVQPVTGDPEQLLTSNMAVPAIDSNGQRSPALLP